MCVMACDASKDCPKDIPICLIGSEGMVTAVATGQDTKGSGMWVALLLPLLTRCR